MSRLLTAVALVAVLLLVGAFVPVNGVTLVERLGWYPTPSSTRGPSRPSTRTTQTGTATVGGATSGTGSGTGSAGAGAARPAPEPVENHSDADRAALDRLVAERAGDRSPAPKR